MVYDHPVISLDILPAVVKLAGAEDQPCSTRRLTKAGEAACELYHMKDGTG
jgi:hypothetical protein